MDKAYKTFLDKVSAIYHSFFPEEKIKVKINIFKVLWITKEIERSSKRKQHLYEKFLRKRNRRNEFEYKNYKTLFEAVKKHSKKLHFSKLRLKYKDHIKKT